MMKNNNGNIEFAIVVMSLWWMLQRPTSIQVVHPCGSALLCCRWRWWRAVWNVQNQAESSPSPEESPTCYCMRTRCRPPQRRPSPELSPRWNCGCFERREAWLIWCHCQKTGPTVCLGVTATDMHDSAAVEKDLKNPRFYQCLLLYLVFIFCFFN